MNAKREEIIIAVLSVLFIFLSISPTLILYFKTPADSVYTFLHNSISDYPYYISFIRQGIEGRITTIDQFTLEDQSPGLIHIFYLGLGRIGRLFGLSAVITYFSARIFFGLLLLMTSYVFISNFIKIKWQRILAFLIFVTSISFPQIVETEKGIALWQYLYWWTEMDPINRLTFIPHFLFGHIGLIAIILLLLSVFKLFRLDYFILSILIGLILGLVHPPSLGMLYLILGLYLLFNLNVKNLRTLSIYIISTVPSLIYIYYTTQNVFPWNLMGKQESLFYAINLVEYLLSLGPVLILGLIGILIKRKGEALVLSLWILIDIIMIPVSSKFPVFSNIRFLSMLIQLPLSILAVLLFDFLKKRRKKVLFSLLISLQMVLTLMMLPGSLISAFSSGNLSILNFIYPKKSLVTALTFLDGKTFPSGAILANQENSMLSVIYSNRPVYFGQPVWTYQNQEKKQRTEEFFSGKMNACQTFQFLKEGKIGYILTENSKNDFTDKNYLYLDKLYEEDDIAIYKFQKDGQEDVIKGLSCFVRT